MTTMSVLLGDLRTKRDHLASLESSTDLKQEQLVAEVTSWLKGVDAITSELKPFTEKYYSERPEAYIKENYEACFEILDLLKEFKSSKGPFSLVDGTVDHDADTIAKHVRQAKEDLAQFLPIPEPPKASSSKGKERMAETARIDDSDAGLSGNETDDDFFQKELKWRQQGNAKKAKKVRQAARRKTVNVTSEFVVPNSVAIQIVREHANTEPADENYAIFPASKATFGWIRSRVKRAPIDKLTRRKVSLDIARSKPTSVEWVDDTEPLFYHFSKLSLASLHTLHDNKLIPSALFNLIVDQKLYAEIDDPAYVKGWTTTQWVEDKNTTRHDTPDIIYFWAAIEDELDKKKMLNKLPFVNKWMQRLASVPEPLRNQAGTVAEKFYGHIKAALKRGDSVNKVFNGFLSGQLADWPVGMEKKAFLEYGPRKRSLEHYWGDYSAKYLELWNELPDAQVPKRLKYDNPLLRTRKKIVAVSAETTTLASKLKQAVGAKAKSFKEALATKVTELSRLQETLTWRERAAAMPGRVRANFANMLRNGVHYVRLDDDGKVVEEISREDAIYKRFLHRMRMLCATPFKVMTSEVEPSTGDTVKVKYALNDRGWWTDTKDYFTSGFIPDTNKSALEDVPVPIVWRSIYNIAKGLSTAVGDGIPWMFKNMGLWWNESIVPDEDIVTVQGNLRREAPDVTPLFKGTAALLAVEAVGTIVSAVGSIPIVTVGAAFGTIELVAWCGRIAINTGMRWLGITKATRTKSTTVFDADTESPIALADNRTPAAPSAEDFPPLPAAPVAPEKATTSESKV